MSWVTVIWSMGAGGCMTLALIELFVWLKARSERASLALSVLAISVAAFAGLELALMRAQTPEQLGEIVRWLHVPAWVMITSLVAFTRLYLRAGRPWLAWMVVGVRTLSLILNFVFSPNINFREITAVRHISFLGETVSSPAGVPNPWMLVAQLSLVLLVIFVIDAAIAVWRRGDRREALVVGGSIVFFVVIASAQAVAITWGIIPMPLTASLFYQCLVGAMAYELGYDLLHAAALSRRLQTTEAVLREGEKQMSLAAAAAGLIVWTWDIPRDEVWLSDKDRALLGFSRNEKLNAERVRSIVHPEDRQFVRELVKKSLVADSEVEAEYRLLPPDGKIRWVTRRGRIELDTDGRPTWERGVLIDITEQKQAQELFQLATEASPSGIILVSDRGHIVLVNSHVEKLFGYHRNELVGKFVDVLVPKRFLSQHSSYRAKFLGAPETRAMGAGRELFGRRKDGSEFPVEIGLNPIQTPRGLVVLANVVDISARLATEEEARRSREQVELLGRVSLLGEMTASLAHELNQPLTAIVNNATAAMHYIEQGNLNSEQLRDILTDVVGDGCRARDIIGNVRSAIKKGSAIRARINLNDVVKTVTRMVHPDAAAQLCKLEMSLAQDLPAFEGDPTQIQQVLINLVRNAFDAMRSTPPSGRKVEIVTTYNGDGTICAAVRDYGSGISGPTRERLFEQFFTTKEEGLGMGLAIVRSIVEAHSGTITAENADGGGARFLFHLPIKEGLPQ
jgi:two-component system, LuxR family, sensor kinase FixL